LVIGYCGASDEELLNVAERVALGDVSALASVDGSRVVIAVRRDDVVVAGDLAGQHVVFHACAPDGQIVIGSHAGSLARLIGRSVDRVWLAARLLVPNASDVWWTGSPWHGVRAVRPGWVLRASRSGQMETRRLTTLPAPSSGLDQAGEALRAALVQSVSRRKAAAYRFTTDLSGGLDSSTLAALAANTASDPVPAITLTVPGVDDAEMATAVAGDLPGLAHKRWPVPDAVLPYSQLDAMPAPDEPGSCANVSRDLWWLSRVAEHGSDLHMSGDGGDAVLLAPPAYLADLAHPRQMGESWRHVTGWAQLRHQAPHSLARAAVALRRTGYRAALVAEADRLETNSLGPSQWCGLVTWFGPSRIVEWMTPDGRSLVGGQLRLHADQHDSPELPGNFGIGDATAWLSLATFSRTQRLYTDLAAGCGVNHHAPYLDDAVVRACWSVPASMRTTPERSKPLLRHAVAGMVPSQLLERRTKGDYTALTYRGLRHNASVLRDLFTDSRLADLGLVNDHAVRATVDRGAAGVRIPLGASDFRTLLTISPQHQQTGEARDCHRGL
jgi:asparagine synthase (glutamine-hydrolysing)